MNQCFADDLENVQTNSNQNAAQKFARKNIISIFAVRKRKN